MRRLYSVLDTNVLISALFFPRSIPRQAFDRANTLGYLLFSRATLLEAKAVLERERFDRYLTRDERLRFWQDLAQKALLVEPEERIQACRDPKDDMFLELAVSGHADVIVTGDDDLLALHPFRGIPILKPAAFLTMPLPT